MGTLAALLLPCSPAAAAKAGSAGQPYAAKEMIRSARQLEIQPGASADFTIGFKNTGTRTWRPDGRNFISVYTYGPRYRQSQFADASWLNSVQPARLTESEVAPGQIGRFTFTLFAPLQAGTYRETFILAAESLTWVQGGEFAVDIEVADAPAPAVAGDAAAVKMAAGYKALKLLVSDQQLDLEAGATKEFRVGFKNIGRVAWRQNGDAPLALVAAAGSNAYSFHDSSWRDQTATGLPTTEVRPGELSLFKIALAAPRLAGLYTARFTLTAGDELIDGGEVDIPIQVTGGQVPAAVDALDDQKLSGAGARGPDIRLGLYYTTQPVVIAADGAYDLFDGDGGKVAGLSGVTTVTFDPGSRTYAVRNGGFSFDTGRYVRLAPEDPAATVFEIQSLENRPSWDPTINFNRYRGALEVRYAPATDRLWVIEQLPVEDYLRGLAETSNASPYEYQKALVTAARTYALFVVSVGGKHVSEFHDLNTGGDDQVYKGYVSELVRPNVVRAAEETRGLAVTYGGEIVVTPYFSRSDGRTRAWTEVWSSVPHPWLVSRPAPYDKGLSLYGHGVGMSANDAVGRAADGADWETILKYYYSGIELKKIY